ncbi:MAG TPA: hypothetical protein VJT84_06005 [Gaiellaceae bacterium]|nr:hypothetical protein [Gaiellaceae bacterium]
MDEPRTRASRRRIGLLVAVPLAGAAMWAGLAMAASGPAKTTPDRVQHAKPVRQHVQQGSQRLQAPRAHHDGHQCPFNRTSADV